MKILFLLLLTTISPVFASSSHHHGDEDQNKVKVYKSFVLTSEATKEAKAVYHCTCEDREWRQDASKKKSCPYCGPAMAQCGYLVKVLPDRKTDYSKEDYDLPNKVCPVSGELIENKRHFVEVDGKKIYVCCKRCISKFEKAIEKGKADRYLRKLPLKPGKFGFSAKGNSEKGKAEKKSKSSHEGHEHHDHEH